MNNLLIMRVLSAVLVIVLLGCTPALNWREVQHPEGLWSATFPDKPVQVTRVIDVFSSQGEVLSGVKMSLWSSRVGEQTFTIGITEAASHSAQALRLALIHSRLKNIGAELTSASSQDTTKPIDEIGRMRVDAHGPLIQARLIMRIEAQGHRVIEAIVAGPLEGFDAEAAETFMQSARLKAP